MKHKSCNQRHSTVDKTNEMIKEWGISYTSFCWWHAPKNHGLTIAMSMAFKIYNLCAEGVVYNKLNLDNTIDSLEFRHVLKCQMCEYYAKKQQCTGIELLQNTAHLPCHNQYKSNDAKNINFVGQSIR